jgi:hypothetical protein
VAASAAPAIADLDGDGTADLVVGDASGRVHLFCGQPTPDGGIAFAPGRVLLQLAATYAAPSVKDMNGDGKPDLVVGNNEGDLRIYLQDRNNWKPAGVIEGESSNPLGSKAIVGGHNSVPLWYDINHDGKIDLLVGQLEFGMPIPTDAPDFPYKQQLDKFIDYARNNHLLLYPHLFVHNYESNTQEQEELRLHRQAFAQLGIPWGGTGTNQHTWRINNPARLQTMRNENAAGLWFNFGFAPSDAPSTPNWGNSYVWGLPFLLSDKQLKRPMVLHAPTPYLHPDGDYANTDVYQAFAALDMPIDYFEHIEYHFPDKTADLLQFVTYLDKLRTAEDYNFVTEQQMAQSFLTALQGKVRITETWGAYLWSRFKDLIGRGTHFTRTIHPITTGIAAEAQDYAGTLGVVVEPGAKLGQSPLRSTADIFTRKGLKLYTAVPAATRITIDWSPEPPHLIRANVPTAIDKSATTWTIHLNADGMQQIKLYSPRKLTFEGDDLKVDSDETQHTYTVTHFGEKTTIRVNLQ